VPDVQGVPNSFNSQLDALRHGAFVERVRIARGEHKLQASQVSQHGGAQVKRAGLSLVEMKPKGMPERAQRLKVGTALTASWLSRGIRKPGCNPPPHPSQAGRYPIHVNGICGL